MLISFNNQILGKIKAGKRGQLVFPSDFLGIAPETAIRKTLSRLAQQGMLIRLTNGIYLFPKVDEELGVLYPSIDEIASAIAKKERIRLMPTGAYALNRLGLSTQVPMKVVYLTDGKARTIKVGKSTITLKPTVPKKLAAKGKLSSLVIKALEELGQDKVDEVVLSRIKEVLRQEEPSIIRADARTAPAWIARILYEFANKLEAQ